jgi:hypothetical protein
VTPEVAYIPVEAKPWRLAMGLRPLAPGAWLEVDDQRHHELTLKQQLLADAHADVVAALPGSEGAGSELLDAVVADLDTHHPGLVGRNRRGQLVERTTGVTLDNESLHPVDVAGRLVQEDLCLMARQDEAWRLVAASLCFPSRWRLADKIGRDLSAIHAPVPGYEHSLARPTSAFFDRVQPERPVWRLNWTLIDHPRLHQPDPASRQDAGAAADPGLSLWFRVERQTLRRLPNHPAVVFTIRTYVTPLTALVERYPEAGDALRTTLPTVPAATVAYKGWSGVVDPVLDWLDARSASA